MVGNSNFGATGGPPFYDRLNLLRGQMQLRRILWRTSIGRSMPCASVGAGLLLPIYFRLLSLRYFEGIDSER